MIKTFADRHTKELYETGKSKRLPSDMLKSARRRLEYLDIATGVDDLSSISINMQWRICFRFVDGDAYDVEITDYH